jgi:hypothetical protein
MKRPAIVTATIAIHILIALCLIGLSLYLLWLTRSPEILSDKDSAEAIRGLKIGAFVLTLPAAGWLPGIFAMCKHRIWGWWLTLVTSVGLASAFLYSTIDDGWHRRLEADDAAITAICVALPILLLLPQVRKYYRKPQADPPSAIGQVSEIAPTTS